jgi:predicted signal transduction protein with EAL and GGDEF domain
MFPEDGDSSEDLMQKADSAMYVAKQSCGNSYQFYNNEISNRTSQRQKLERLLREAVQNGELELLFQPQVSVQTRRIVGVEALLRWHHPEDGLLLPGQFLNVAEETGAIVPIGEGCRSFRSTQQFNIISYIQADQIIPSPNAASPHFWD